MSDRVWRVDSTTAMSCRSSVGVVAGSERAALAAVEQGIRRVRELERRWTRFSDCSEVSRLNAADADPVRVSTDTVRLVEAMVRAWHATRGAYDPTLLAPLVELGYAASRDDATRRTSLAVGCRPRGRVEAILVDAVMGEITLPAGTLIDPGGIGKGVAADLITEELVADGAAGAMVEIGGDLAVRGQPPAAGGWPVAVVDPVERDRPGRIELAAGGVATSSSRFRTWTAGGTPRHHLLDPRTLLPTDRDVVACTVIAGTAGWAEAFAKVAFVEGTRSALERYEEVGLAARITTSDGGHHCSPAWRGFCR